MASWASFFQKLSGKPSSKDIAKERLKLVLFHDRIEIPPALVDKIKDEIIEVLGKYLDIDTEQMDVELTRLDDEGGRQKASASALVANIPIKGVKDPKKH